MAQSDTSVETKQWRWKVLGSYVCIAAAVLVMLDVGARLSYPYWHLDSYNSPNRSWIWWNTQDFRRIDYRPDVVLMGSSLMMAALHGGDATYLKQPQNVSVHHRSTLLETKLQEDLGEPVKSFAFAIGGQMASDAYAISSTLLRGERAPRTLVYGIAPRDFMDNTLTSPASTETYRYMSRIGDLSEVDAIARPTFWERVEYTLGKISFIYGHRPQFIYLANKYTRELLKATGCASDLTTVHAPFELRKIAMFELPEDNGPNELFIMPYDSQSDHYVDNLPEYRRRYRAFKPKLFETQLSFLERLMRHCDQQGINLILVNMPLTTDNVALMPSGFYQNYLDRIQQIATAHQAQVLDMNRPDTFTKECFGDSVHLNGLGGERFFTVLAKELSGGSRLAIKRNAVVR